MNKNTMQYIMFIHNSPNWDSVSKDEKNRIHEACGTWHEELVRSGHSRGAVGLQPASTSTTLRQESGNAIVTDGPFIETKEVLGGFEILECANLDEALAIAKRFPALQNGSIVELRPVLGAQIQATVVGTWCHED
ncbi:MAG TPA: YciI family protein [Chthoniobacteraceae bacterium]|nr:YciI family protein [Chthoniobacteraceae bacterium]